MFVESEKITENGAAAGRQIAIHGTASVSGPFVVSSTALYARKVYMNNFNIHKNEVTDSLTRLRNDACDTTLLLGTLIFQNQVQFDSLYRKLVLLFNKVEEKFQALVDADRLLTELDNPRSAQLVKQWQAYGDLCSVKTMDSFVKKFNDTVAVLPNDEALDEFYSVLTERVHMLFTAYANMSNLYCVNMATYLKTLEVRGDLTSLVDFSSEVTAYVPTISVAGQARIVVTPLV